MFVGQAGAMIEPAVWVSRSVALEPRLKTRVVLRTEIAKGGLNMTYGAVLGWMALLQALAIFIIKLVLENTVKFEFRKREQAALVASLFAEWIDNPKDRKELNRLTWEATLWLPDELARAVNKRLNNAPDAKNMKVILVEVKGLIQGRKSKLDPEVIVHFPKV
jgi:hypothetical protein